jgi:hypothetical protein
MTSTVRVDGTSGDAVEPGQQPVGRIDVAGEAPPGDREDLRDDVVDRVGLDAPRDVALDRRRVQFVRGPPLGVAARDQRTGLGGGEAGRSPFPSMRAVRNASGRRSRFIVASLLG